MAGALREIAASFGIEFDSKALTDGVHSIDGAVSAVRQLATVIAGAELVRGVSEFIEGITETGSRLQDASDRLGVTTRDLQQLQFAAGQAGVRGEQLNAALSGLSANMEAAKAGTGGSVAAFHALGVRVTDLHGRVRPVSEVMDEIAHGMDRITDPARRVTLASDIFGRAGRRLVGVLHGGEDGLAAMRQQLEDLGGGMSNESVAAADAYGDSLERLHVAQLSIKSTVANLLLPTLTGLTDWISHSIADFGRLTAGSHLFQVGITALSIAAVAAAAPVLMAWAPVIAPFLLGAAALAAMVLVVDDLWVAFNGGDSVIGSIHGVRTTMNDLHDALDGASLAWRNLRVASQPVADEMTREMHNIANAATSIWNAFSNSHIGTEALEQLRLAWDQFVGAMRATLGFIERVTGHHFGTDTKANKAGTDSADAIVNASSDEEAARLAGVDINASRRRPGRPRADMDFNPDEGLLPIAPVVASTPAAVSVSRVTTVSPTIHVHGVTDPERAAQRAAAIVREQAQAAHDADHPREPAES